jgi:hypothetical protein
MIRLWTCNNLEESESSWITIGARLWGIGSPSFNYHHAAMGKRAIPTGPPKALVTAPKR